MKLRINWVKRLFLYVQCWRAINGGNSSSEKWVEKIAETNKNNEGNGLIRKRGPISLKKIIIDNVQMYNDILQAKSTNSVTNKTNKLRLELSPPLS